MKRVGMGVVCALFLLSGCAHMGKPGEYFQRLLAFCHLGSPPQEKKPEVCILDPASYVPEASPETASREKPPVVEVPVTAHDFGRLSESEDYVHKFSVRNAGKSVLSIKKVVPGWGSSVAQFDKAIPPGGEGTITLRLNPKACSGKTEKSILVTCNDPRKPYFILILKGQTNG